MELQDRVEELRRHGLGLATISYDSREILADFAQRHGITFPMLSDVGSATIKRYGILNTVADEALGPNGKDPGLIADFQRTVSVTQPAERFRGIAFPGTFMLDRQGRVTARFFEDYYWERNTSANIMLKVSGARMPVPGIQASTEQLELKAYPSDASASPGTRFAVIVDVTPKRGMHVYAPGAKGYKVIALDIEPQPYVRITPVRYPASELYDFVPLNERVPVYQRPFTLTADVVPEATPEARKGLAGKRELVIKGTLQYQACDDKICYIPASVPLSWKVALNDNVAGAPRAQ